MTTNQTQDPADVFASLSDPTRVDILLALDDADDPPLAFSDLHDRVDCDDSARFNYHLQKLRPALVRQAETGYALAAAGERVVRAVRAGTYAGPPSVEERDIEGTCGVCGAASLVAAYEHGEVRVDCRGCDDRLLAVSFPPSGVRGRDLAETLDAFDRWGRLLLDHAAAGVCPVCAGVVERTATGSDGRIPVLASFRCRVCEWSGCGSVGAVARRDRRVRGFLRRQGIDPAAGRYWEIPQFVDDDHVDVRSRDPWRVGVAFPADGVTCRAVVDGDLDVTEVTVDGSTELQ